MLTGGGLDVFFEFYGLIGNTKNKNNYVSFVNRLTYGGKPVKSYLVVEICWCRPRPNLHFLFDELLRGELKVSPHPLLLLLVGLTVEMADGFP